MTGSGASRTATPLKILMTADAVGGVWQYCVDLVTRLADGGTQVWIATMGPRPNESQKERVAALRGVTLCESDYKLEWMHEPWADVDASGRWLQGLAQQMEPDVVHLNGYAHAALPWKHPIVTVAHSCVYSWWHAVHRTDPPQPEWSEYHRRVSAGLQTADAVIAPSFLMAACLNTHYGLLPGRAHVIHNFSESPRYCGAPKEPFVLTAGRNWDVAKNLELLPAIQDRLLWPVEVAGSIPHETVLRHMQRASVYAHPAVYEPFGLAVLEAARAQCCLALSDIPSLRELWDGAAVFVNPRDPGAWVDTLNRLACNSVSRESLAHLAQLQATRYSSATATKKYVDVYESLARRKKPLQKGAVA